MKPKEAVQQFLAQGVIARYERQTTYLTTQLFEAETKVELLSQKLKEAEDKLAELQQEEDDN